MEPLQDIVKSAVSNLLRKRAPGTREEMMQEGMAVALETARRYPKQSENGAYVYRAVIRRLGNFVSHELAAVSIAGRWAQARDYQKRVEIDSVPAREVGVEYRTPEHDLLDREEAQTLRRWRFRLREYLNDRALPRLDDLQQTIVLQFYGLDGLPPRDPRIIAADLHCDVVDVYQARERLERLLRDDLDFFSLRQQLWELQSL